jgi:hypothetical protein
MVDYGRCCHTGSWERAFGATPVGGASPAVREIQEEGLGILTDGFNGRSRGGDELAMVGNKTRRREPACAAPGTDTVELVVKTSAVERVWGLVLLIWGWDCEARWWGRGDGRPTRWVFKARWLLNLNRGGESTGLRFDGEIEGGEVPARFSYAHVREGSQWRHMARRREEWRRQFRRLEVGDNSRWAGWVKMGQKLGQKWERL